MTTSEMTAEYLQSIVSHNSNVGILQGSPSNGLCSIDIDCDDELDAFCELNDDLVSNTTITRGKRGLNIWFRFKGNYPKLTKLHTRDDEPWGEFRSDGAQTVFAGEHPQGGNYKLINAAPPLEIEFSSIVWPSHLVLPWASETGANPPSILDEIIEEHGEPFEISEKGAVSLNQGALAEIFIRENLILFEPSEAEFYIYEERTGAWQRITPIRVNGMVERMIRRLMMEQEMEDAVTKITAALIDSMVKLIKPKIERPDAFHERRNIIHLKNGVIDLDAEQLSLVSFSPEFYSRNQIPVDFNPDAECPRFINELLEPCLNESDIDLLQRWMGSALLSSNHAQAFMLITGAAAGGKSTFVNLVEHLIGPKNVHELRTGHLGSRFETQFLIGKKLLTGKDVPSDFLRNKNAYNLKKLVGGDRISAEKKGSNEALQIIGDFHCVVTANSRLFIKVDGDSDAWRRRILLIEWGRPEEGRIRIPNFDEVLFAEEGSGIFNWMLEGALKHKNELDQIGKFALSEDQQQRVDDLLDESDSVRAFIYNKLTGEQGSAVTSQDLNDEYSNFCRDMGWEMLPEREIFGAIQRMIYERFGIKQSHDIPMGPWGHRRGYRNIKIIQNERG